MHSSSLKITKYAACLVIVIGVLSLTGWIFDFTFFKSVYPDLITMKVNAAVLFIMSGFLLLFRLDQINSPAYKNNELAFRLLFALVFIISAVTLFEYIFGINFGIDQLLAKDLDKRSIFPGRMAPNTAVLFLLSSFSILLLAPRLLKKYSVISAILSFISVIVCLFSLDDYPKLGTGNVLGNYNPMAYPAAFSFIMFSLCTFGLAITLSWISWSLKRGITIGFIIGLTLILVMSLYSNSSTINLRESYISVVHTDEVRFHINELQSDLEDVELYRQNYLLFNDIKYSNLALKAAESFKSEMKIFKELTQDNQHQQDRVRQLEPLVIKRFDILQKTFLVLQSEGVNSAIRLIQENKLPELIVKINNILLDADNEELSLLKMREEKTTASTQRTFILLPVGALVSLAILVWIFILLNSEVAERKNTEEHLKRVNRLYSVLSWVSHLIVQTNDKQKLFDETCRILVEYGKFKMAWIGGIDEKTNLVKPLSSYGNDDGYLDKILISINDSEFRKGPTGTSIITGQYNVCNDIQNDPRMTPWKVQALKMNFRSSAAFPVKQKNNLLFPLTVYSSELGFFDESEIRMMNEISLEISFALDSFDKEEIKKKMEADLREAFLYNRSLLEASLDPLVTINPEGKITDVNNAVELVTGINREQLIGSNFSNYFTEPGRANEGYQKVFSEGFVKDYPLTVKHKYGSLIDVLYNASLYRDELGQIQGIFAAARDVTELKKKENELTKLNDNLLRSNAELEQFAYVASHDLQEPLRMVSSYTQLLGKKYKDKLDNDANDFINFAVDGAARMQRLINDLLDYSRVTTKGKPFADIELSSIIGLALTNLHEKIIESGTIVINNAHNSVYGDEIQLMRVFQNLIDNAVKFKGDRSPEIYINSVEQNGKILISVKDNGIGIDSKYKDRVFVIFQRLHGSSKYPGTGIGLAICKRTIERHGGSIWLESVPGHGTTFFFTLNKRK
ncbi:MAG: ATP-binding protein [Ignavibacteriaceae bacterium]|nr:ATP-binding protein [Ignavibacteriaceae bacterium]